VLAENRKVIGGDSRQVLYVPFPGETRPAGAAQLPLSNPDVVLPAVTGSATSTPRDAGRPTGRPAGRPSGREEGSQ